jgi:mRNA interferase MazF
MKRGEIRTVAGVPYYTSKPRPVVIVQADWYTDMDSITVCPLTSDNANAPSVRIPVLPTEHNGLRSESWLMPDKVVTVPKARLGPRIGQLDHATLAELSRRIISFLNLAESGPSQNPATTATRSR